MIPASGQGQEGLRAMVFRNSWSARNRARAAVLLAAGLVGLLPLLAAPVAAAPNQGPIVGHAVMHDVSPALRDLAPLPGGDDEDGHGPPQDLLENRPTHAHGSSSNVTDPVVQTSPPSATAPSTSASFEGISNLDGVYPPDTNGDVGPNHYIQWVNLHFAIYSKTGAVLYGPAAGNTLWSGFGNPCQNQNGGDPIVQYDQFADRWLMAQFTTSKPYGECVAVSTSPDPTGSWNRYFFQFSTRVFYDYPKIGVWPDGYYLTANRFGGVFGTFQGASAIVLDRAAMLAGQSAAFQEFTTSSGYGSLLPGDVDGSAFPPSGAPEPIVEVGASALHTWRFHVDWSNPSSSTFTGPSSTTIAAYNELCPSTRSCIPQPGTSIGLDGLGDRLMYRLAYRNFGDHESLVVNHSVNVNSSGTVRAGVRWYEIRNATTGTPSLFQQGTFSPDATNRWLGSVAMDGAGNIALGYSVASSSVSAGIRVTGRLAGDAPGVMTQAETTIAVGGGAQTGSASRWGDYASMSVDPTDDCTFWFTSEYMPTTGPAPWQTRIASFTLPGVHHDADLGARRPDQPQRHGRRRVGPPDLGRADDGRRPDGLQRLSRRQRRGDARQRAVLRRRRARKRHPVLVHGRRDQLGRRGTGCRSRLCDAGGTGSDRAGGADGSHGDRRRHGRRSQLDPAHERRR